MLQTPTAMAQTSAQKYFMMSQSFWNETTDTKEEVRECRVEEHEDDDIHWSLDETEYLDDVPSFSHEHTVGLFNIGHVQHGLHQYEQALHCTIEALQFYRGDDTQYLASLFFNVGLLESLLVSAGKTAYFNHLVSTETALQQSLKILMRNAPTILKPSGCDARLFENTIHRNLLIGQTVWLLDEAQRNYPEEAEAGGSMRLLQNVLSAWCYSSYQPHSATFQSLQSLGTLYMKKGDLNYACCFLLEALRMGQPEHYPCYWGEGRSSIVTDDTTILELWAQLGECHQLAGRNVEALSCFKKAIVILKQSSDSLVSKSSDEQAIFASVLFNIGLVHASSHKKTPRQRQKALHSFALCLDVRRASLGHDHPAVAHVLYSMAMIMKDDGQVHSAVQLLRESVVIRCKAPIPDFFAVAPSLLAMATIHEERGEYLEALLMYQELLALLQASSIIQPNTTSTALFFDISSRMATTTTTPTAPPILSEEDVWIRLGHVQQTLGQMDGAKESYEQATRILRCQLQTEEEEAATNNCQCMPLSRRYSQQRSAMIEVLRDLGYVQLDRADRTSANAYFEELSSMSNEALPWSDFNRSFSSAAAA
jgi:tetratricopeptide (TPR) repeat protein